MRLEHIQPDRREAENNFDPHEREHERPLVNASRQLHDELREADGDRPRAMESPVVAQFASPLLAGEAEERLELEADEVRS